MRKISMIILVLALAASMCACGRRQDNTPSDTTTTPSTTEPTVTVPPTTMPHTTAPTIIPDMPEMDTNIPDPTVDSSSTDSAPDSSGDAARRRNRIR